MKQYWQQIVLRIDGLSLRERTIIFVAVILGLVTVFNTLVLDVRFAKQKQLTQQIRENQTKIAELHTEIEQKAREQALDPDAANRNRLQALKQQAEQIHAVLHGMQTSLVAPDKMADLLESMLRQNGKLRLISLRTLSVSGLNEAGQGEGKAPAGKAAAADNSQSKDKADNKQVIESIYKHGVELRVQGSYSDIVDYLTQLEALPWQLFWGKAKLNVEEYPKATLSLTLFTLSLDRKWLNT